MNYKLIKGSLNDITNPKKTILLNRGVENWKQYLSLSKSDTHSYELLKNIQEAVDCFVWHINNCSRIHIIVDSDVDGYCSGSMVYRYVKHEDRDIDVTYSLHTKKQHGLSDDVIVPDDCKLLIIPDAGSNDIEQCEKLSQKGMDIIILDHHICDKHMPEKVATVVNNQIGDYPNKNFCGAGIVYKFLKAVDEEIWGDYADEMLDLVALANISDVMDMREPETRYYVDYGLSRIKSKLFKALIEKQSYSMKDVVNIQSVQFYVTPILNALIRVGSEEDKDLLFRAFIETDELFKYKKRGETEEVDEDIYTRAARICYNAKNRQGKEVDKGLEQIEKIIEEKKIDNDKILFINVTDVLGQTLTGLVAIKIAEKYNKPCLLLRRQEPKDGETEIYYGGSCRNFDYSPVESLKDFLCSTNVFEFVQGHDNAAGLSIKRDNIQKAIDICNDKLNDVDFSKCYNVDFEMDCEELTVSFIKSIDEMKDVFGQGIKEPLVMIKNVPVCIHELYIMGKNSNTWKITSDEGYAFVKFMVDTNKDPLILRHKEWSESQSSTGYSDTIDVIGTVSINNFNNILTPQINVKDYVLNKCVE